MWKGKGGDGQWANNQFSLNHVSTWNSKESKNSQYESGFQVVMIGGWNIFYLVVC